MGLLKLTLPVIGLAMCLGALYGLVVNPDRVLNQVVTTEDDPTGMVRFLAELVLWHYLCHGAVCLAAPAMASRGRFAVGLATLVLFLATGYHAVACPARPLRPETGDGAFVALFATVAVLTTGCVFHVLEPGVFTKDKALATSHHGSGGLLLSSPGSSKTGHDAYYKAS